MKKYILLGITGIIFLSVILTFAASKVTEKDVIKLVDQAVKLIEKQGELAIKTIADPKGPFYVSSKSLYVFIYDENCVIKAHPYKPTLVGRSYRGKPDVRGKKFRDEIVQKALEKGQGWTEYSYQKPGDSGIFKKKVFGKRATVGKKHFIVCAGMYMD
ncbi:secreted protein containing Cache, type 2 domain protein [Candidatus Magnetomorum sp. HK-1]|nr:secreted protein containing Cache, type 2 domain protein [Candidatus Magnetomorum sp. HK-1]